MRQNKKMSWFKCVICNERVYRHREKSHIENHSQKGEIIEDINKNNKKIKDAIKKIANSLKDNLKNEVKK